MTTKSSLVSLLVLGGCAVHARYAPVGVEPVTHGSQKVEAVGVIDARADGAASEAPLAALRTDPALRAQQFAELSGSVATHLERAGILASSAALDPAPTEEGEVRALLASAAKDDVDEVWFLRLTDAHATSKEALGVEIVNLVGLYTTVVGGIGLVPLLVADSLPVNHESGGSAVEAVVVDPQTGEVLARVTEGATFENQPTLWALNPHREEVRSVRTSVDQLLRAVVAERDAGFPHRARVDGLERLVLQGDAEPVVASADR